ncbi:fasciclin domain-containing protein [Aquipuribacter sp. SD81]|uniref:fasciclin domain-containing protein n=1 Tax=Aquipuribacter sp. SD81 TaxID=3127703 RepID=UPI003016704B
MKIRIAGPAVALSAALVLAACGDDADPVDEATDAAVEATEEAAEATEEVAEETEEMTDEATAEMTEEMTEEAAADTIVDVAASNPDFSTLVTAVEAAGLVETLSGAGPFTVFAPTNEAFDALPEGVLDALLLPENQEVLTDILTYHVLDSEVTSDMITAGEVETVQGDPVTLATDGGVTVNGATVVTADVEASNGVIHAIDAVLLPEGVDPAALVE